MSEDGRDPKSGLVLPVPQSLSHLICDNGSAISVSRHLKSVSDKGVPFEGRNQTIPIVHRTVRFSSRLRFAAHS